MNSSENWELKIEGVIYKELKKFPQKYTEQIVYTIESLRFDPYFGDIQKIKDEKGVWRSE